MAFTEVLFPDDTKIDASNKQTTHLNNLHLLGNQQVEGTLISVGLLTGSAGLAITGDVAASGHSDSKEFVVNAFQYPAPGTDWTPQAEGAGLGASLTAKKAWLPLNFLKIGDEIVSYKLVGDIVEAAAATLDCKLVKVNKANPITTTDVTGGGITQLDADGNFDALATLGAVEVVATDKAYLLEILGTTGVADAITVMHAEVKVNRKV